MEPINLSSYREFFQPQGYMYVILYILRIKTQAVMPHTAASTLLSGLLSHFIMTYCFVGC